MDFNHSNLLYFMFIFTISFKANSNIHLVPSLFVMDLMLRRINNVTFKTLADHQIIPNSMKFYQFM